MEIDNLLFCLKSELLQIEVDLKEMEKSYKGKILDTNDITKVSTLIGAKCAYEQIIKFIEEGINKGEED